MKSNPIEGYQDYHKTLHAKSPTIGAEVKIMTKPYIQEVSPIGEKPSFWQNFTIWRNQAQYGRYQVSDKTLHTQEVNLNREDVKIVKNINEIKSERREIKINTKPYTQKVKPGRGDIKISAKKITRSQVRYGDINIITKRDTESSPIGGHIKIFTRSKTQMKSRQMGISRLLQKTHTK
jgi:hypothetical protein